MKTINGTVSALNEEIQLLGRRGTRAGIKKKERKKTTSGRKQFKEKLIGAFHTR